MQHPDWPAFIAAIVADPDDDTARLVAADFLEENGDADRAAFIRIQVELACLESAGAERDQNEIDRVRVKERAYLGPLSEKSKLWAAEACPELVAMNVRDGTGIEVQVTGSERLSWGRGFIEGVTCPVEVWARHGAAVRRRQPIRSVILTGCDRIDRGQWYAIIPTVKRLKVVTVQGVDQAMGRWLKSWLVEGEELIVV